MKKNVLAIMFLVVLTVAGSFAVWANQQSVEPPCDKCAKVDKQKPCCAKEGKAVQAGAESATADQQKPCCAKAGKAVQAESAKADQQKPCCAKEKMAAQGCPQCAKLKASDAKSADAKAPAGSGCDKCPLKKADCDKCPKATEAKKP